MQGDTSLFSGLKSEKKEDDPLQLARENKELEQRLLAKDAEIKQLEEQVRAAELENEKLLAEKK